MQDDIKRDWLDKLEVTDSIKGIMDFVDELSQNYDKRVASMHLDYQKDIEELLDCYKTEKQDFASQISEQNLIIDNLENQIQGLQERLNKSNLEYKASQISLSEAKHELAQLTDTLKKEEEILSIATDRINNANDKLKQELLARGVEPAESTVKTPEVKKQKLHRTRNFLKHMLMLRLNRPIILRSKNKDNIDPIHDDEEDEKYSF